MRPLRRADMIRLVRRRTQTQDLLLSLWKFGDLKLSSLKHPDSTLFHLLLGSAFSLWRAAFLVQGRRTVKDLNEHALEFLRVLTWDNVINYSQDRQNRAWTVGYYLNNAHWRLRSARVFVKPTGRDALPFDKVARFLKSQTRLGDNIPDMQSGWDDAFAATRVGYRVLRKRYESAT